MTAPLERVLYVEDDSDIQEIALMALVDLGGLAVKVCSSGMEALKIFPEFCPQMVLLDVMMPGMDGPTTMASLRTLPGGAAMPVAFMTAKVQSHEVSRYRDMGAIGVISKPFDPMTLADQVRALWAEWRETQGGTDAE
ncbi:response regulator [Novispirillum itersonii]|uniref:CheY-like chemotaxis protein n=1 Tax=Novispirillum itersonii TaxID=189 RepID=A0A7W9ZG56_NOVIT|nr:response regulator [Novispirillum itersonii]MBB6210896.1 CheY-like chemotaxis protein [Novispirillum itersonii]